MQISPYVCFNGNCKTAFDYYVKNLGAKMIMCMTYADAPPQSAGPGSASCPPPPSDRIMHARIQLGENFIMGSDSPPERFEKAQIFMPLGETFWAKKFAMLKDQFGVSWMINCEKESY
jgi:PhnB protein